MLLVYLAAAWSAGIAIASLFPFPLELWGVWLLIAPRFAPDLAERPSPSPRSSLSPVPPSRRTALHAPRSRSSTSNSLASLNDRGAVVLMGQVSDPPEVRDRTTNCTRRRRRAFRWTEPGASSAGNALVQVPRETNVRYGDHGPNLRRADHAAGVSGFFVQGLSGAAEDLFAHPVWQPDGAGTRPGQLVDAMRSSDNALVASQPPLRDPTTRCRLHPLYLPRTAIYASLPDPAASLLAGILLGVDSGIPRDVSDAFSATNTAHIIAISGFNIAIIAGILTKLSERTIATRSRGLATLLVLFGLAAYSLMVGASASVIRAAIMGSMSVVARYLIARTMRSTRSRSPRS